MKDSIRHIIGFSLIGLVLSGCRQLAAIPCEPPVKPEAFLQSQPWISARLFGHPFILTQPTSTVIVYFVGLFTIYTAYRFLRDAGAQRSRTLWGWGLLLTGAGALCAGTSYQMLGYEIKCAGRDYCSYTSWWEVSYMLLSLPGLNAFLSASAYTSARGKFRKAIISYAIINTIFYCALLLYGAFAPVRYLVSFDFFVLMGSPAVFFLLWLHSSAFRRHRELMDLRLSIAWLIFTAVTVAYVSYMILGITQTLWTRGIWFSDNDILHTGLIIWVYYLLTSVKGVLKDSA